MNLSDATPEEEALLRAAFAAGLRVSFETKRQARAGQQRAQVWSSGGGVQSAAIAALIVSGRLPKPDFAVIADTGREQSTTWTYMDAVTAPALAAVGVTLHRVPASQYATVDLYGGADGDSLLIPAFTNQSGEIGKLPGYCSNEWKRRVVQRWVSEQGVEAADLWIGISTDEMRRVSPSKGKWQNRYVLIEQRMNRNECEAAVARLGWPKPPRSSCWMCPNHTQVEWRDIRDNKPDDWEQAIRFDREIRERDPHAFVHSDCVPLDEADLDDHNEVLFGHDCTSGLCFV